MQNRASSLLVLSVFLILQACASKHGGLSEAEKQVADQRASQSTFESFQQGLIYIREHPTADVEARVQRFLWLDQWIKVLEEKQRLTHEMAMDYWNDMVSYVRDEPALDAGQLDHLLERVQTKLGKNVALYYRYQNYLRSQSLETGLKQLESVEEDGVSDLYGKSQELLQLNRSKPGTVARKIGVLLPLSGDLQVFGQEVLKSIEIVSRLAFGDGMEFAVQDTGTTQESLLKAWDKLALQERVTAIIGPLTTKDTKLIFERAQVLQIPVISLAPKEDIEGFGQYGFRSSLAMDDQVKAVARFISKDLAARRVAVLMPDSSYGWDVMSRGKHFFADEGLEIAQMQIYPAGATDFKEQLRRMTRMDFPRVRKDEICSKEKGAQNIEGCAKKWTDLKPIIDFEVLFVPDFADTVGLLLPTLPYLQLYGVQVVGLSGFNSKKLLERAQDSAEGVVFTDSYLPASHDFATRFFRKEFEKASGAEPSRLAAEAFDVAMICAEIMKRGDEPISRDLFLDRLRHISGFNGATGSLTVENQRLMREPKLITVRDGKFQELRTRGE